MGLLLTQLKRKGTWFYQNAFSIRDIFRSDKRLLDSLLCSIELLPGHRLFSSLVYWACLLVQATNPIRPVVRTLLLTPQLEYGPYR